MRRSVLVPTLLFAALALPASAGAQATVVTQEIGDPAAAAAEPVKQKQGRRVGRLLVERTGDAIRATVSFKGRPPKRRVRVCVKVAGEKRCVRERPGADRVVALEYTATFVEPLKATARWGKARALVRM